MDIKREGKLAYEAVSARTFVWSGFFSMIFLPLVSFAMSASIVTSLGTPTPPLEACFDLSQALASGTNQAVKVTVSAYETQDNAVSFDRVQLRKKDGALVGTNVASKTDALPKGSPVSFSFDNFGVAAKDLADVNCVSITFLDHGGKNSTGFVTVKAVDVKVTRDEGDACVIIDPVIVQTPPKQLPLVADVVQEGRIVQTNAPGNSFTLTVSKNGTGSGTVTGSGGGTINCGSTCTATVVGGLPVSLTASAASGSTFAGWSGACASYGSSPACGITMSASTSTTATFNTSGGGGGGACGGGTSPEGPCTPTSASNGGSPIWGNVNNIFTDNDLVTSNIVPPNTMISGQITATGFGFAVPAGMTIHGIELTLDRAQTGSGTGITDYNIYLWKNGTLSSNLSSGAQWSANNVYEQKTFGGSTNLWGATWGPVDIDSSGFGFVVGVSNSNMSMPQTASIDVGKLTVWYSNGGGSIYDAFTDLIHALSNRLFCIITNASSCAR